LYDKGSARTDGLEHTERRIEKLKIVSCKGLVQHIDIPEFGISERLSRPTYLLNSPESPVIYISGKSTSGAMSLNYLTEPLATYFGVSGATGDIRAILTTPDEHIAELFTAVFHIPELPESWKDSTAIPSPSFTELAAALVPTRSRDDSASSAHARNSPPKSHATVMQYTGNHPTISEMSNAEAHSVMEVINGFFTRIPVPALGSRSDDRPWETSRASSRGSKKNKSRQLKLTVSHSYSQPLQLSLPSEVDRNHRLDPAVWPTPSHSSPSTSAPPRRHQFQDFETTNDEPNLATGFAGEYFVGSQATRS
jgi:hypothetical protein